jgi:hypothetical protein
MHRDYPFVLEEQCRQESRAVMDPAAEPKPLRVGAFFGENYRSYSRSGFVLSDTCHPQSLKAPPHYHELAYFTLLLQGGYWEEYGKRRVTYQPLSIVFHPPQEVQRGEVATSGARCFHVEIAPQWLDRLQEHGKVPHDSVDIHAGEIVWLASRLYREFRAGAVASPLVIEGIILEMMGLLVREPGAGARRAPKWLAAVVARLHEEFSQTSPSTKWRPTSESVPCGCRGHSDNFTASRSATTSGASACSLPVKNSLTLKPTSLKWGSKPVLRIKATSREYLSGSQG